MRRHGDDDGSMFPQVVAWLGLAVSLLLFFGNTVPAVREHRALRATQDDLRELRRQYDLAIASARAGTPGCAGDQDLQSVLVAIDRIGWTPAELLACYPEPSVEPPVERGPASPRGD
jgi:hypothetical protein